MGLNMPNIMQGFGLELTLIAGIGYLWFQSLKNRKTPNLMAFFKLCSALLLYLLINIPVRISDLNLASWAPWVVFVLNALFVALQTLTAYEWFIYFLTVQGADLTEKPKLRWFFLIPLLLMVILLGVSYKTHWLLYVNEQGNYMRGTLFFLQFLLPYSYLAGSFVYAWVHYKKTKNRRLFSIFFYAFFTTMVTSVLQVFFSGSFTHAGLSLAVLLIYIEMYQNEIKQMENMKSLEKVNRQLEIANDKLHETVQELEISVANERAANNAKNDFLSRMSHDIRTPLNGILGIIEIDDRHPEDVGLLTENRKKAKVAASHLLSLINDILDMSKLNSGKYELAREPFVMSELLNEVVTMARSSAASRGITLLNDNENDDFRYPSTIGSPLHINRVLLNIMGNAIKYNRENGSVRVDLQHEWKTEDSICYTITIADTGIGMSEEYMKTLFEPFSQERIDARSVYGGSGLGMAITKALIDKMGGTISVQSEEGVGSVFTIQLTFETVFLEETGTEGEENEEGLNGYRILLAEDNELNVDIAVALLEDFGAEVDVAENGQSAVEKFSGNPAGTYDAILMDCMMPVMDGYSATRAIRNLERADAKTIPIIAMTANAFADDIKKCLESGMNDHLPKPFQIQKVLSTIRKHAPKEQ